MQRTSAAQATAAPKASTAAPKAHKPWNRPKKPKKPPRSRCCIAIVSVALLTIVVVGAAAAYYLYRERYPLEQRCPPEGDRFHDHCKEGRKHYLLKLDWSCLGHRRAEAMRMALSLPDDGKPLEGVGEIPSWLTADNAKALTGAPCMREVLLDMACRYCKPTPKPNKQRNEALEAEYEALMRKRREQQQGTGDSVDEETMESSGDSRETAELDRS